MEVALVTVGDEILDGDTENTNATWLSRQLTDSGVTVTRVLTVPDDVDAIASAVAAYGEAFDAVIVTGGLGRTPDDVTIQGVAGAFDRDLVENDLARVDVERTLESIAGEYPDLEVDAAAESLLPEGARPLLNRAGLSPGCVLENVYVLPGIPSEMETMFEDVSEEFAGEVDSRFVYTDEPEANLIERLDEVKARFDVKVGCYPNYEAGHNRLKLTGEDDDALEAAATWLEERVATTE